MRILICEDSVLLREGLIRLLQHSGHEVVAALPDASDVATAVENSNPELCILDVRLPPSFTDEGIRAALALRAAHPELPLLVLSQYVEEQYAAELIAPSRGAGGLAGGSIGYLLKDRVADVADFVDALERVAQGGTVLDPEVVSALLTRRRRRDPLAELSPREREVLALMAEGRTNNAIGRALVVTPGAVEKHISSIFGKLGLPPSGDDHRRVMAVLTWLRA